MGSIFTAATGLPAALEAAYAECNAFAGRDKPHLYSAAQGFGYPETRRAFVATYASMRLIDDAIDGIPHRASLSPSQKEDQIRGIDGWLESVRGAKNGIPRTGAVWLALSDTFSRFDMPLDPWDDLAQAMSTDVVSSGFRDWNELRRYMRGASVAPAVVFMHLVLMRPDPADGVFRSQWAPGRVQAATEDLAIFCYWVHILRDAAFDLSLGGTGLVYFPESDLNMFGLRSTDLHEMRRRGRATKSYRELAAFEAGRARRHLADGLETLPEILGASDRNNGEALCTLIRTYQNVLEELEGREFDVFSPESIARKENG